MEPIAVTAALLRAQLPDLPLREGATLMARVASRGDQSAVIVLAGVPLTAQVPPEVQAGATLRLKVQEVTPERITLQIDPGGETSGRPAATPRPPAPPAPGGYTPPRPTPPPPAGVPFAAPPQAPPGEALPAQTPPGQSRPGQAAATPPPAARPGETPATPPAPTPAPDEPLPADPRSPQPGPAAPRRPAAGQPVPVDPRAPLPGQVLTRGATAPPAPGAHVTAHAPAHEAAAAGAPPAHAPAHAAAQPAAAQPPGVPVAPLAGPPAPMPLQPGKVQVEEAPARRPGADGEPADVVTLAFTSPALGRLDLRLELRGEQLVADVTTEPGVPYAVANGASERLRAKLAAAGLAPTVNVQPRHRPFDVYA